jgi:streptomycin 6-kinase
MTLSVPAALAASCNGLPERIAWLKRLPDLLELLARRWSVSLGQPFEDATCAWVAPAMLPNGTTAVLKLGMPHMEAEHEPHGIRFWQGDPTVRLLDADDEFGAMLLERCDPGTKLSTLSEPEQDLIIAGLLPRLWRIPDPPYPFRPLSAMTSYWAQETRGQMARWCDSGLVREGLDLFQELSRPKPTDVLLATDLHAGNVLKAQRQPWLVIDPKPFVGDPAYDATQHLFNCIPRLIEDPDGVILRVAEMLEVSHERVRLWMFARAAAEPRVDWVTDRRTTLARRLSP